MGTLFTIDKNLRDYLSNSRNCTSCNITKGLRILKNGFADFNINEIKNNKLFNENCKLYVFVKKISGNGSAITKIDNFTKKINIANVQRIELPNGVSNFSISRSNDSIGDIAIVNISCCNNGENMSVVKNKKLVNTPILINTSVINDNILKNIKICNDFLFSKNILLNYKFEDKKKVFLFSNIVKSYDFNVNDLCGINISSDYLCFFMSKCKYVICDNDFYIRNRSYLSNSTVFLFNFTTKEKNVINNFSIEEIADYILNDKEQLKEGKDTRFKIIVPAYNSEKWIDKTLSSIVSQKYTNYDVMIIDDCSTDSNQRNIIKTYSEKYDSISNQWKYIFNTNRMNALYNTFNGINNSECSDEDVIVILDGDDWLYDENVLTKINYNYFDDIYMTYGQYITYPGNELGHCREISKNIVENKTYRKSPWLFSHLRTFKFELFRQIKEKHFLDVDGKFMKMTGDLAVMYPIAEMANGKIKFISDILYVYNDDNPINDNKVAVKEQARIAQLISSMKVYNSVK